MKKLLCGKKNGNLKRKNCKRKKWQIDINEWEFAKLEYLIFGKDEELAKNTQKHPSTFKSGIQVKDKRRFYKYLIRYQKDHESNFRISDDRFIVGDRPYADT